MTAQSKVLLPTRLLQLVFETAKETQSLSADNAFCMPPLTISILKAFRKITDIFLIGVLRAVDHRTVKRFEPAIVKKQAPLPQSSLCL